MPLPPRRLGLAAKALLGLALPPMLLGIGEVLSRVGDRVSGTGEPLPYPPKRYAPYLLSENAPNFRSESIQVDERGFRSRPFADRKPGGAFRLFLLGGSTAVGYGIPSNSETITGQLLQTLESRNPGRAFEVVNAAVSGYTSTQELILLHTKILRWEPDVVVVLDGRNDFYFSTLPGWRPHRNDDVDTVAALVEDANRSPLRSLLRRSSLFRRLGLVARSGGDPASRAVDSAEGAHEEGRLRPEAVDLWARNLKYMHEVARSERVRTFFLLQPSLAHTDKELTVAERGLLDELDRKPKAYVKEYARLSAALFDEAARRIEELRAAGVEALDCRGIFGKEARTVFTDECHLNALGARYVADRILEYCASGPRGG
ncbi:MAG TPA: GDSL-type esterase/lipase family protein [Planctomycetota bacterium]|nr:GDSL-type esterase/lipase family protein [Planctomycetota bacterium]